jgi:hypothetical protein
MFAAQGNAYAVNKYLEEFYFWFDSKFFQGMKDAFARDNPAILNIVAEYETLFQKLQADRAARATAEAEAAKAAIALPTEVAPMSEELTKDLAIAESNIDVHHG